MEADRNAPVYGTGEVQVEADPETVWGVLADIRGWPTWNPDITGATLQGPVRPGTITSTLQVVGQPTELTWTGKTMGIPAIHVYRLRPSAKHSGHTIVSTEESWAGCCAGGSPSR